MTVKLSGALPGGDRSGLDVLHGELVKDPKQMHYVVGVIDCDRTTVDHGAEGATYTPRARLLYVEAALDDLDAEVISELLGKIRAQRVGEGTEPLELRRAGDQGAAGADTEDRR